LTELPASGIVLLKMRTLLCPSVIVCLLGCALAALAEDNTSKSTPRLRQAVSSQLPKFIPPPAAGAETNLPATSLAAMAEDDTLFVLPEFRVMERKIFEPSPDSWLTSGELTRKAVRLAEREMNSLELALNRWHIPLLTPSFAARARATYREQQLSEEMERLDRLLKFPANFDLSDDEIAAMRGTRESSLRATLDLTRRRN
jgi:hypothetical protein